MGLVSALITLTTLLAGVIRANSKIILWILLILTYILFAFEHSDGDYTVYVWLHNAIGPDSNGLSNYEILYVWVTRVANSFGLSFDGLRGIISLIDIAIMYYITNKYTPYSALVFALFFIFPATLDAELFRWQTGMFLLIWGFKYLIKGENAIDAIKYIIIVSIAGLFHTACWIFLIYLLVFIKNRKTLVFLILGILLLSLAGLNEMMLFKVFSLLPIRAFVVEKYTSIMHADYDGIFFHLIKQIIIFSMVLITYLKFSFRGHNLLIAKDASDVNDGREYIKFRSQVLFLNIISFLLLIPLYFSASAQRLVHVIIYYNYIVLANRSIGGNRLFFRFMAVIYAVVFLLSLLFLEGKQTVYEFNTHFTEGYIINLLNTISDL